MRNQSTASLGRERVEIGSTVRRHWGPHVITVTVIVIVTRAANKNTSHLPFKGLLTRGRACYYPMLQRQKPRPERVKDLYEATWVVSGRGQDLNSRLLAPEFPLPLIRTPLANTRPRFTFRRCRLLHPLPSHQLWEKAGQASSLLCKLRTGSEGSGPQPPCPGG